MNELFQLEQFSRDAFRVKRTYIDVTGDLIAGLLLGQIVYWNLPNENGKSKLRVYKEGEMWLAKGREDWWEEIRITPKQFDRALNILKEKGFVTVKKFRFNGSPMLHIKLEVEQVTESVNSKLLDREIPFSPKVKNQIPQTVKTLTETTTQTTTNNKYSNEFEEFWRTYPRKVDKKKASKSFNTVMKKYSFEEIIEGTKKYAASVKNTEKKYIKHPTTFLNNDSFIDGYEEAKEEQSTPNEVYRSDSVPSDGLFG